MTDPAARPSTEGRLVVGLVRGVHGLRGAVRVEVLTDDPSRFAPGSVMHPEGGGRQLTVIEARPDGPGLLVHFAEVTDRNAADALREAYLEAAAPDQLESGSYYWHEVVGTTVVTGEGEALGRVEDVFRAGEAEVYVVRGPRGEVLVPAVAAIVMEFAPREGRIVVDAAALGLGGELDEVESDDEDADDPATERPVSDPAAEPEG